MFNIFKNNKNQQSFFQYLVVNCKKQYEFVLLQINKTFFKEIEIINRKKSSLFDKFVLLNIFFAEILYKFLSLIFEIFLCFFSIFLPYLVISILNVDNVFFSHLSTTEKTNKFIELEFYDTENDEVISRSAIIYKFIKDFIQCIVRGKINLGKEMHLYSEGRPVIRYFHERISSYTFSIFKFAILILFLNIIASFISFYITWYFTFPRENKYYQIIVCAGYLLPMVSFLTFNILFLKSILERVFLLFDIETLVKLEESKWFFFANLLLFFISLNAQQDINFFMKEKTEPYLNTLFISGIKRNKILKIMSSSIIKHKISSFNLSGKLLIVLFIIRPLKFKSLPFMSDVFQILSSSCCFNPYMNASKVAFICTSSYYLCDFITRTLSFFFFSCKEKSQLITFNSLENDIVSKIDLKINIRLIGSLLMLFLLCINKIMFFLITYTIFILISSFIYFLLHKEDKLVSNDHNLIKEDNNRKEQLTI